MGPFCTTYELRAQCELVLLLLLAMTATAAIAPATTAMVPTPTPAMVPVLSPTTAPLDWPPAAVAGCSVFAGAFGAADLLASCACADAMLAAARKTTTHIAFDLFTGASPNV